MLNTLCTDWNKNFEQLHVRYDESLKAIFFEMQPSPLPSFTPRLLDDINKFQQLVGRYIEQDAKSDDRNVEYLIFGSGIPDIFQLGGDLQFFVECITSGDRETLSNYAKLSIDVLYANYSNLDLPVTTISLVSGSALGAGFEAALSSDYIIAEPQVDFQFPEVVFNMFPGMGAYSFLSRRIESSIVDRMILGGKAYNAVEMYEKGIVDHLAEPGKSAEGLAQFIRKHRRTSVNQSAVLKMRKMINPVTKKELLDIAELWVESAFSLKPANIKAMSRIVKAQSNHLAKELIAEQKSIS